LNEAKVMTALRRVIKLSIGKADLAELESIARSRRAVKDRHRSREFIEFLKLVDAAYLTHTAIRLILDNHSAAIARRRKAAALLRAARKLIRAERES
jgi:hypothetical protein